LLYACNGLIIQTVASDPQLQHSSCGKGGDNPNIQSVQEKETSVTAMPP